MEKHRYQMDLSPINSIKKELDPFEYEDFKCHILDKHFNVEIKVQSRSAIVFEDDEFDLWRKCEDEDLVHSVDLKKQIKRECSRCHKILENGYALLQHNLHHMKIILPSCLEEYKYKCKICSAYYKNKKYLNSHYFNKHEISTREKVVNQHHECKICKKFFTYKIWHSHMREVHRNQNISCDICQKTFTCWRYLRNHLNRHQGITSIKTAHCSPVKCDQCPAVLKHKNALTTHKRNCHSDEIFVCKICNSKLKSHPYLITHMKRVHYDDGKEYSCICGKSFRSPRYLKVHKKNSHH